MNKKKIITIILLISMLVGCEKETVSMDLSEKTMQKNEADSSMKKDEMVYVFISGQVKNPGVYQFRENPRMFEVIQKAGGFTKNAEPDYLNQAEPVSDGQSIYVMSRKEYRASKEQSKEEGNSSEPMQTDSGKVNLNQATEQELTSLPGIGTTKAKSIIEYREKNGRFTKCEDLKKVSGIGDATYLNLEGMIAVD